MRRVAPTERIRKRIEELMTGYRGEEAPASLFMQLAAQKLAQELLEAERADVLGREPYERKAGVRGYRNGYEPGRLRSAEGKIPIELPQVRQAAQPFRPRLLEFLRGHTDVLKRLAVEMYARGLSTRDIEDALYEAPGERMLSRTGVSEVTEVLWKDFEAFSTRDLSGLELECLFLDAVYESLRLQAGAREGILCAWGILRDGHKVLIHMTLGNKESHAAWLGMIRDMVRRGLRLPVSVTSDGAPGLIQAIEETYPTSLRIHCWAHRMRNIVEKLPQEVIPEIKAHLVSIRDAATFELGEARAREVIRTYQRLYPSAMTSLASDLEASLNHLKLPVRLRKSVRTTNLLERSFEEERRRTKVIPRFFDEKSCLKLVFAVLVRVSARWQRVRLSAKDLAQLDQLRARLGQRIRNHRRLCRVSGRQLVAA